MTNCSSFPPCRHEGAPPRNEWARRFATLPVFVAFRRRVKSLGCAIALIACLLADPAAAAAQPGSQTPAPDASLERVRQLIEEVRAASFPELQRADIHARRFRSASDYFQSRFGFLQFFFCKRMRYFIFANAKAFARQAPDEGLRAIIAHELGHTLYYKKRNRLRLFGLVRLASKGFTARFERWADLQAIARGYGEGLKAYRLWLYQNVDAKTLVGKRRNYFSPEEIEAILAALQRRPALIEYWLKDVPRNLEEIRNDETNAEKFLRRNPARPLPATGFASFA